VITNIAILEPHEILRQCLAEILIYLNYDVIIKSGSAFEFLGLLAASEKLPNIIISEVKVEDHQHVSLFRHLRYHYPDVRLVAFSADDSEWTVDHVRREGADAFIPKGCSLINLQETLLKINSPTFPVK